MLASIAGLLALAACGDSRDITPANAQLPAAPSADRQQRSLDDVVSQLPAGWPATEAMRDAEAFPPHGSPWYPTPALDTSEDSCLDRVLERGVPQPC